MPYIYNDEDNAPMDDRMLPAEKNCHERCRYSKECYRLYHLKGSHRADFPDECAVYYKLDDLAMEARDIPFFDPDDIPEEEEALDDDADS